MFRREFLSLAVAFAIVAFAIVAFVGAPAHADRALLTVDATGYDADIRSLTDADLMALPQTEFTTTTIWTDGPITFSGPSLAAVLEAVGATGANVSMVAVNDYKVDMSQSQIEDGAPIIANRINGAPFSIRDKGPLWVVFPFDESERFQTEEVYSLSVWHLTHLRVLPE